MLYADWLGAPRGPRLRTSHTIGARGIKTWHAFGASIKSLPIFYSIPDL